MIKQLCPICNEDLSFFDLTPMTLHLKQHVKEKNNKVFEYIQHYRHTLPKGLLDLYDDRNEVIKKHYQY